MRAWWLRRRSQPLEQRIQRAQWPLGVALLLLILGTLAPMITLKKLFIFEEPFSLLAGLVRLFQEGEYALFGIILVFSVVFPLLKICLLLVLCQTMRWTQTRMRTLLHWVSVTGRWSMLDVFIVALLVQQRD